MYRINRTKNKSQDNSKDHTTLSRSLRDGNFKTKLMQLKLLPRATQCRAYCPICCHALFWMLPM